ncbi:MAG TPA: ABC transporter permease [Thermoanaerobaculia bacterium]|jgi:simple sugar transport system permease protein
MIDVLTLTIVFATPLLLAVLGELVVQRSGMINLGVEGMMLVAAMSAIAAAQVSGSATVGILGGIAGAAIMAVLFGLFAIVLRADQIVTGTALNLLALGVTSFVYRELQGRLVSVKSVVRTEVIVSLAWIVVPIVLGLLLWRSAFGLRLRACGENPEAAEAAGASVAKHRAIALGIEAVLAGLAGGYLSLVLSNGFAENMTAGRGFIALSIVIFGRWKVKGAIVGTAIFGLAAALQYALQAAGRGLPFHLMLAIPYVVTLLILCGVAGRVRAPESLGRQ